MLCVQVCEVPQYWVWTVWCLSGMLLFQYCLCTVWHVSSMGCVHMGCVHMGCVGSRVSGNREILLLMSYSVFTKHSEQYVGDIKSLSHTGLIHISDVNIVCEDQNDWKKFKRDFLQHSMCSFTNGCQLAVIPAVRQGSDYCTLVSWRRGRAAEGCWPAVWG